MRFFFRSRQFKIIISVFLAVIILATVFRILGKKMAPTADIAGTIAAPFQSLATKISEMFSDLSVMLSDGNELLLENTKLESEINELRNQMSDYDEISAQNEFYKKYLGLKEANPDFEFAPATLISRDSDDPYGSFVINQGSSAGISLYDPVYNDSGSGETLYVMDQVRDNNNHDEVWLESIAISEAMKKLNERERTIINKRYYSGKTQIEIAADMGISQAQVSRLEKTALGKIRKEL